MNPVALYFASGESFYLGSCLLLSAIVVSPHLKRRWMLLLRNIASWIALALMVVASPPFCWVVDVMLLVIFSVWFISSNKPSWTRLRLGTAAILFLSVLVLSASEFAHRRMPLITGAERPFDDNRRLHFLWHRPPFACMAYRLRTNDWHSSEKPCQTGSRGSRRSSNGWANYARRPSRPH